MPTDQIERYGGAFGIRGPGVARVGVGDARSHVLRAGSASVHLREGRRLSFHLVKNHPFVDGNKRVGLASALAFLGMNELRLAATDDELVELVLGIAESRFSKSDAAVFLAAHLASPSR